MYLRVLITKCEETVIMRGIPNLPKYKQQKGMFNYKGSATGMFLIS